MGGFHHFETCTPAELITMAPADFSGKWILEKSNNFYAYLAAIGQGDKQAPESGVEITVIMAGDSCTIVWDKSGFTIPIVPGSLNEFTLPNGHVAKVTPKWEGAVLASYSAPEQGHVARRYMEGDHFVQEYVQGSVSSKRYFKRV